MDASQLNWLSATDAARAIRDGAISAEQLTDACLARVREASAAIALAVAEVAFVNGLAGAPRPANLPAYIRSQMYEPIYGSYV